jgi:IS4 transposase
VKGRPLGALAGFFDWQSQSRAVVGGVRFTDEERSRSRALFLDSEFRVLAASDGVGVLRETHPLRTSGQKRGSHADSNGRVIGSSPTPGHEIHRGLGWYGVVEQQLPRTEARHPPGAADDEAAGEVHGEDLNCPPLAPGPPR